MIQIYKGNGKGKTTCATGIAVRASGHGIPVIFAQFMKNGSSGEIRIFEKLDNVTLVHPKEFYGFLSRMTEEQRQKTVAETKRQFTELAELILGRIGDQTAAPDADGSSDNGRIRMLVVMDEVLNAVTCELLDPRDVRKLLDRIPSDVEVILTGRNAAEELAAKADYITSFEEVRHPYRKGVMARLGVEF